MSKQFTVENLSDALAANQKLLELILPVLIASHPDRDKMIERLYEIVRKQEHSLLSSREAWLLSYIKPLIERVQHESDPNPS